MNLEQQEERLRLGWARQHLLAFTCYTMPDYQINWHHQLLCRTLDRVVAGEIRRAMIFMPPQHGKSELVSRRLPAFLLGRDPETNLIACSYTAALASRMSRDVQRIVDSEAYQRLFPDTNLRGAGRGKRGNWARRVDLFEIVGHRGVYRSAGVGGGITGMGFDVGLIDDPVKDQQQADSPRHRTNLWEWFTRTFFTRRRKDSRVLITLTRWHRDDLAGRLLACEEKDGADRWHVLSLPALRLPEGEAHPEDPRAEGEPLWPARHSAQSLAAVRAISERAWSAMYQQQPQADGSSEWDETYFGEEIWFDDWPEDLDIRVLALDPSKGTDARESDYAAFVLLGVGRDGMLYADARLLRTSTDRLAKVGIDLAARFRAHYLAIESNQFQHLLGSMFRSEAARRGVPVSVLPYDNRVSKGLRIRRLGEHLANGTLRFKRNSPGTDLLVGQLRDFPNADYDDGPDALELAIRCALCSLQTTADDGLGPRLHVL